MAATKLEFHHIQIRRRHNHAFKSPSYLSNDLQLIRVNYFLPFFFSFPLRPWHRSVRFLTVEKRAPKFFRFVPGARSIMANAKVRKTKRAPPIICEHMLELAENDGKRASCRCGKRYRKYPPKVTHTRIIVII